MVSNGWDLSLVWFLCYDKTLTKSNWEKEMIMTYNSSSQYTMNGLEAGTQAETMGKASFPSPIQISYTSLEHPQVMSSHLGSCALLQKAQSWKCSTDFPRDQSDRGMSSGEDTSFQVSSVCVKLAKQMIKQSSPLQQPPTSTEEVLLYWGVVAYPSKCTTGKAL